MSEKNFKQYIVFWASQSVSQLGSAMTSYALIIWAYKQTNSAMSVSLMTFFSYLPYIIVSIFAGNFIDKHFKKHIMIWADSIAALCSLSIVILLLLGNLEIWYIYVVNAIVGFMNAFQSPAQSVTVSIMVPKEKYAKASGMDSFSGSLLSVIAPMFAAFVSSIWGLEGVLIIDFISFLFAFIILTFFIHIPEKLVKDSNKKHGMFYGCKEGISFLQNNKGLWYIILSMALLNFFSRLTYENILGPMILARSGDNDNVFAIISGILGIGGIIGGILVSLGKLPKDKTKLLYFSAAFSFLFGDLLMGLGQSWWVWGIAAIAASVPLPFVSAGQRVIMYNVIPNDLQGRVFAIRNGVQYCTIPIGILLGGYLADYVFEPFMNSNNSLAVFLHIFVGNSSGSGMAVMFICTGILGSLSSIILYKNKEIKKFSNII
jgi:MFS transporter, DHA3 family, macrolide efflux protein